MEFAPPINALDFEVLEPAFLDMQAFYKDIKKLVCSKATEEECIAVLQSQQGSEAAKQAIGLAYGYLAGETWLKMLIYSSRDQCQQACAALEKCLPRLKSLDRALAFLVELAPLWYPPYPKLLLAFIRSVDTSRYLYVLLDRICEQPTALPSLVFYRVLRLASLHAGNDSVLYQEDVSILNEIWRRRKSECLAIGRDLIRVLASMCTYLGLDSIWNDLMASTREGIPLYVCVLSAPTKPQYHSMLLTPVVEERLGYLMDKCNPANYSRYMRWLIDGMNELSYPDFLRLILTRVSPSEPATQKHVLAAWLLNTVTINYPIRAWLKQALVFDVLFLNPQEGVAGVEPFMSCLKFSLSKFPQLTEEIIEFLLISAEKFDPNSRQMATRNIKEAFHLADIHSILPTEALLATEKLAYDLRRRLSDLLQRAIPPTAGVGEGNRAQELSAGPTQGAGERFAELGKSFAQQPSLANLSALLKFTVIDDDLTEFVLKTLTNDLLEPLSPVLNETSLLFQIFTAASTDPGLHTLLKSLKSIEPSIGLRMLIYSLRAGNSLYQTFDQRTSELERELQVGVSDMSLQTLHWVYPVLFRTLPALVTPEIVRLFLQTASPELLVSTEFDLMTGSYEIFRDKVEDAIVASAGFSSTEQLYLWKLVLAEVKSERVTGIIKGVQKVIALGNQWESISCLIECLSRNKDSITAEQAAMLLSFPAKHFSQAVHIALIPVRPVIVKEAVVSSLSKPGQSAYNILRHVKYWAEQKSKLGEVAGDEALLMAIKGLPTEIAAEFALLMQTN